LFCLYCLFIDYSAALQKPGGFARFDDYEEDEQTFTHTDTDGAIEVMEHEPAPRSPDPTLIASPIAL
jgi:hypothetical protein